MEKNSDLVFPQEFTWQDVITAQDFKKPGIIVECDEITLRQNGIEIVFGKKDFSQYKYIEINGIKFIQEKIWKTI